LETDPNFVRIELIDDPAAIAEFGFEACGYQKSHPASRTEPPV
jgi:hypothetical protein